MGIQTLRTLTLVSITLLCLDEIFRFVDVTGDRVLAALVGLAAIALYWYFGRLARESRKGYGWLLIPPVIFTIIPVYLHLSKLGAESGVSWWGQFLANLTWFLVFVAPIGLLMWIYYALRRHMVTQAAS